MLVPRLLLLHLCSLVLCDDTSNDPQTQHSWSLTSFIWQILTSDELEPAHETEEPGVNEGTMPPLNDVINESNNHTTEEIDGNNSTTVVNEIDHNATQTRIRHECIPYEGCSPPLNCSSLTNINDSNLVGVANQGRVVGINTSQLHYLLENLSHTNICAIVMFYDTRCQYSIDFGWVYNKLGVVFPQLPVVAIDYGNHSSERYLLAYVPRVILYYSGRVVYDIDTNMKIENLTEIIANMTSVVPSPIPSDDVMVGYESPIPKEVVEDNFMLYLATASIAIISIGNCMYKSDLFAKWKERLFHIKRD